MATMLNYTDRRLSMAQKMYMFQFDKNITPQNNFDVGDCVFFKLPPTESRTVKQKDQNEANFELLIRTHGPFEVVQVFEYVVVLLEDDTRLPTSIDR